MLFCGLPQAVGAMGGLLHSFSSGLGKQLLSPQKRPSSRGQGPPAVAEEEAHMCVPAGAALALVPASLPVPTVRESKRPTATAFIRVASTSVWHPALPGKELHYHARRSAVVLAQGLWPGAGASAGREAWVCLPA